MKHLLLFITIISVVIVFAEDLKPFTSDGCSAFPEGTIKQNELWLQCCTLHDFAYWKGGTYSDRLKADQDLQECVKQVGEPEIALLMLAGVRVGGTPFLPTTFRWGYGWSYPRFYGSLTEAEVKQVDSLTKSDSLTMADTLSHANTTRMLEVSRDSQSIHDFKVPPVPEN